MVGQLFEPELVHIDSDIRSKRGDDDRRGLYRRRVCEIHVVSQIVVDGDVRVAGVVRRRHLDYLLRVYRSVTRVHQVTQTGTSRVRVVVHNTGKSGPVRVCRAVRVVVHDQIVISVRDHSELPHRRIADSYPDVASPIRVVHSVVPLLDVLIELQNVAHQIVPGVSGPMGPIWECSQFLRQPDRGTRITGHSAHKT